MVTINKYIKALLHPAGGHQGNHKAHQAGNQKVGGLILPSNFYYKVHQIPTLNVSQLVLQGFFSAQSIEARCLVKNEDVVGAVPAGDAPTTSEWSTILLPTKVHLILEVWQYVEYCSIQCWPPLW